MGRLPFDPEFARGGEAPRRPARREQERYGSAAEAKHLTVSQLSEMIRKTLEDRLPRRVRVLGEISNLNRRGHAYFSLKDDEAVVNCVAWASKLRNISFDPRDGTEVIATGYVSHFGPQGRTQLYVERLESVGAGALDQRFRALCDELRRLGWFDEARKQPIPICPRRVAVVTSATGAALQDVIRTASDRCVSIELMVIDVRVQGDGAAQQVVRAIRAIGRQARTRGIDTIIITRGGGSIEDLWPFNERDVAEAALNCPVPVVAAIGHESDTTIIELIADRRASTPTQATMIVVPDRRELDGQITQHTRRLQSLIKRDVNLHRRHVDSLARHQFFRDPRMALIAARKHEALLAARLVQSARRRLTREHLRLERAARRLETLRPAGPDDQQVRRIAVLEDRLRRAAARQVDRHRRIGVLATSLRDSATRRFTQHRQRLDWLEHLLHGIEVHSVLRRGFSYTRKPDSSLIRSVSDVEQGDPMITHVADGTIRSTVGKVGRRPRRARSADSTSEEGQLDLFDKGE